MQLEELLAELKSFGSPVIKNTFLKHGAKEPVWGVKVADMKGLIKKIKNDQHLALQLYDSGISDAMYLAGLVADGSKMSRSDLLKWADKANWQMLSEYTVPWVTSENKDAVPIALDWIESKNEAIAASGWCTLSGLASIKPDHEIDINLYRMLLVRVEKTIHQEQNRVRYCMNGFVIAVGGGISELNNLAMSVAKNIGTVQVNSGETACKVPNAPDYLQKIIDLGRVGRKRKTMKC